MAMNTQGRPTGPGAAGTSATETFTGNRGLDHEEPLIFEIGSTAKTGVDLPDAEGRQGAPRRPRAQGVRSACPASPSPRRCATTCGCRSKNYAIDTGIYPLGSCTMKHNPRLNEKMARLPGFGDIHPLQPQKTVQGAIELMETLVGYLLELTGMPAVALSPKAGAHGELCGMLCIKAAHEAKGSQARRRAGARQRPRHQPGHRRLHGLHASKSIPATRRRHRRRPRRCRPSSAPTSPRSC